jgi:hypothetical protein
MRIYLQSRQLGQAIGRELSQKANTQQNAAKALNITQGQISHIVAGDFKTKNSTVIRICKYVKINPDNFRQTVQNVGKVDREAVAALARACGGQPRKTEAIIKVLRALEEISPAE